MHHPDECVIDIKTLAWARRDQVTEKFWLGPVVHLGGTVVSIPVRRAGDLGSNPGPGENFFS